MTDARVGSIYIATDARGDNTVAYTHSMCVVTEFLPDHRHIVYVSSTLGVVSLEKPTEVCIGAFFVAVDEVVDTFAQANIVTAVVDSHCGQYAHTESLCFIVDAGRPASAQAGLLALVVNTRNILPRALVGSLNALVNTRVVKPPALSESLFAVANALQQPQAHLAQICAITNTKQPSIAFGGSLALVSNVRQSRSQVCDICVVLDGKLSGVQYAFRHNRMRQGKRSKIGGISQYGDVNV